MFLCRGKYEYGILGRLLQRLEERVEGGRGEHVNLIDHVNLVLAVHGRYANLLGQIADIINGVVTGGIKFKHIV